MKKLILQLQRAVVRLLEGIILLIPMKFSQKRLYCYLLSFTRLFLPKTGIIKKPVMLGHSSFEWDMSINSSRGNFVTGTNSRYLSHSIHHILSTTTNENKVNFIDCGANVGIFSRLALDCNANVKAIEPQSKLANRLAKWVSVTNCAISDKPGSIELVIPSYSTGSASVENNFKDHLSEKGIEFTTEVIHTLPLSDFIESGKVVNILKLDVEGHELAVLESAKDSISYLDAVIIEISVSDKDKILRFFADNKFVPVRFDPPSKSILELKYDELPFYPYEDIIFFNSKGHFMGGSKSDGSTSFEYKSG